jgi:hypothetical protein
MTTFFAMKNALSDNGMIQTLEFWGGIACMVISYRGIFLNI